jgi:hypothetical protein
MKTSIAVACYISNNRDRVPDAYMNDYLYFIKTHISTLEKMHNELHKIYFVCTYDEVNINMNHINSYFSSILESNKKVVILNRQNTVCCYYLS